MALTTEILGGPVQLTGIPCWIKVSGGVAPVGSSEYMYLLQVISTDGKLLVEPEPDAIAPDENGEVWFDISGIVDQPVKAVFQYPPVGAFVAYPTQAFNIQVKTGESYVDANGTLHPVWGETSEVFQMLKGGVSQRQIANWSKAGTNFFNTYILGGKFLTYRPQSDIVHPTQPVKLCYMLLGELETTFEVKYYFSDGTNATYSTPIALNGDNLYEFNCNPAHLGVNIQPAGKKVLYFDVKLGFGSDVRRFVYNWDSKCERPMFVLFANSIGGVDDVFLSGRMIDKFDVQGNVVSKQPERDATIFEPVLVVPDSTGQNTWAINSGFKTTTQMLHLRDMLVSRQKWLLYPNLEVTAYTVIPVITPGNQFQLIDRTGDIHDIDIAFAEAEQSQFSFDNRLF